MRRASGLDRSFFFMGRLIPVVVGGLIVTTLVVTILSAIGGRNGFHLANLIAFWPSLVLAGQAWRLLTWVFYEPNALSLVFGCLGLVWFGGDLIAIWGARRFLLLYLGIAALAAGVTTLLALAFPSLDVPNAGMWSVLDALLIAWAIYYPSRQILMYFVLPISGRNLVWLVIGGTVLFALLDGVAQFIPNFLAEVLILAYLRDPGITRFWRRLVPSRGIRRPSHLREVKREMRWGSKDDEPPRWYH